MITYKDKYILGKQTLENLDSALLQYPLRNIFPSSETKLLSKARNRHTL